MNKNPQMQKSYTPSKLKNRILQKILNFVEKQELPVDKIWANIPMFPNGEIKL